MTAEITVRDLKYDEVLRLEGEFLAGWNSARNTLLALFEGKAHKAMKVDNFEEYAKTRLGVNISDSTIHRHLSAARVDRNVLAPDPKTVIMTVSEADTPDISTTVKPLPLLVALELAKLPDDEQKAAYGELETLRGYGHMLPKDEPRQLRNIVARRLGIAVKQIQARQAEQEPAKADPPKQTVAATPPAKPEPKPATVAAEALAVAPVKPKQAKFCEATWELKYLRVDISLPDGSEWFALVPKGAVV